MSLSPLFTQLAELATPVLGLVSLLSTTTACIFDPHFHSSRIHWDHLPSDGVHVGGTVECGIGCKLDAHDVITSVDGRPATDAHAVYATLADGRKHTLAIHDTEARKTVARIRSEHIQFLGLATREELDATPARGRNRLWGFSVYSTVLYDPPPAADPFRSRAGSAVFAVLMPRESDYPELMATLTSELERVDPNYHVLIFRPYAGPELVWWSPDEIRLAHDYPDAVTLWPLLDSPAKRHKRGGPLRLRFGVAPSFVVLDCNLVVRWHDEGASESGIPEALAFTAELGTRTSECWLATKASEP